MSGDVVEFRPQNNLHRGRLYSQRPVPRPAAGSVGSTAALRVAKAEERQVTFMVGDAVAVVRHMQRISILLDELKTLTGPSHILPPQTASKARLVMNRARMVLDDWRPAVQPLDEDGAGEPQPELDDEKIERMYRSLNPDQ